MVGLMATSSKRANAIPRSAAPRAPVPEADHRRPVPPQERLTVLSQSLWGPWVLVHTRFCSSSKSLFPWSCVSPGGSLVGLKVTSSKRAYAIPKSAAPKAPVRVAVHG